MLLGDLCTRSHQASIGQGRQAILEPGVFQHAPLRQDTTTPKTDFPKEMPVLGEVFSWYMLVLPLHLLKSEHPKRALATTGCTNQQCMVFSGNFYESSVLQCYYVFVCFSVEAKGGNPENPSWEQLKAKVRGLNPRIPELQPVWPWL